MKFLTTGFIAAILVGFSGAVSTSVGADEAHPRIVVTHPYGDESAIRSYNLNREVSPNKTGFFDRLRDLKEGSYHLEDITESAVMLARKLMAISGVTALSIERYSVKVFIGTAFRWESVEPQVIAELQSYMGTTTADIDTRAPKIKPFLPRTNNTVFGNIGDL